MIGQTLAIFLDAYRELNSRKLFWLTMLLSGLVVLIYAAIGIDKEGVTFLWFHLDFIPVTSESMPPELLYKQMFMNLGLKFWLSWIATILALVSTAGMIPEMVSGGSIEMLLSKPISRTRLFLTKYAAGLLFAALQVAVFSVACLLVIGIRGGVWEWKVLLAIPLVIVFFSYLFAFCALVGLITRSTIAALLLTMLFWFMLFIVNMGDGILLSLKSQAELQRDTYAKQVEQVRKSTGRVILKQKRAADKKVPDDYVPTDKEIMAINPWFGSLIEKQEDAQQSIKDIEPWAKMVYAAKTALPKTSETISLLERSLYSINDLRSSQATEKTSEKDATSDAISPDEKALQEAKEAARRTDIDQKDVGFKVEQAFRDRSPWWVLGTSLLYEALLLFIATVIFAKRDF